MEVLVLWLGVHQRLKLHDEGCQHHQLSDQNCMPPCFSMQICQCSTCIRWTDAQQRLGPWAAFWAAWLVAGWPPQRMPADPGMPMQ